MSVIGPPKKWPTKDEIEAATFDRKTLAQWGLPWPPPKGWKRALIRQDHEFFMSNKHSRGRSLSADEIAEIEEDMIQRGIVNERRWTKRVDTET